MLGTLLLAASNDRSMGRTTVGLYLPPLGLVKKHLDQVQLNQLREQHFDQ